MCSPWPFPSTKPDVPEPTVVILLSDKRSGSTMFEEELRKHPHVQTVRHTPHAYRETHHWLKAAVVLESASRFFAGGRRYPGYGSVRNARVYLLDGVLGNVPGFRAANDRELVFEGWEALCREFAQPVFLEKSPQHPAHWAALSLLLEWSQQTSFRVKFVVLLRNPLAVMYSARKLFGTDPWVRQFGWAEVYRNLLAFQALVPVEDLMTLRYEELLDSPVEVFSRVCAFLDLPSDHQVGQGVKAREIPKWKSDSTYGLKLDESVLQLARRFGYSNEDLHNPNPAGRGPSPGLGRRLELAGVRLRDRLLRPWRVWRSLQTGTGAPRKGGDL